MKMIKPTRRLFLAAAPAIILAPSRADAWWQSIQQVAASAAAALPSGALAEFNPANFVAATKTIPNSIAVGNPATQSLTILPRRQFAANNNAAYGPNSNLTVVDANALAPDGTNDASTVTSTAAGSWFLQAFGGGSAGSSVIASSLVAGNTYTFALSVKWLGTGTGQFKFGTDGGQTLFTATSQWQRFTFTTTFTGSNFSVGFFASPDSGTQPANFAIIDFEVFLGPSDLNTTALTLAPQALRNADLRLGLNVGSSVSSGRIVNGSNAFVQSVQTIDPANSTVLYAVKQPGPFSGFADQFEAVLSQISTPQNGSLWQNFSTGPVINNNMGLQVSALSVSGNISGSTDEGFANTEAASMAGMGNAGSFVMATRFSEGTQSSTFINGVKVQDLNLGAADTGFSPPLTPTPVNDFWVGTLTNNFPSTYDIYYLVIFPRVLSDAEVQTATAYIQGKVATNGLTLSTPRTMMVFGTSITQSVGSASDTGYYVQGGPSFSPPTFGASWGFAGNGLQNMLDQEDALNAQLAGIPAQEVILSIEMGANDLGNGAFVGNPTGFLTAYAAFCDRQRALGRKIIVHTVMSRLDTIIGGTQFNLDRDNVVNPALKTWVGVHADALCDIGSDPTMGTDTAPNNTTLFQDLVHPTTAGYAIWAPLFVAAVNSL
jgi:lysophospholipase L1-like esterase